MTSRDDFDATTRQAWDTAVGAAEAGRWTARDQSELNRVLTAQAQQHPDLPPNWQAWADEPEPELSPLHKVAAIILLDVAGLLVLLVIGRIVWQGISTVVGLR